jgi:predicted transcriptional regulator
MLGGFQDDVPVVERRQLVGVLGREEVLRAAVLGDTTARVQAIMRTDVPVIRESDSLELALERLQSCGLRCIPVVRKDELVGVLPIDNVAYVLRLREQTAPARAEAEGHRGSTARGPGDAVTSGVSHGP